MLSLIIIFDTCDVMFNWFISLLPLIVLDNLFENYHIQYNFFILIIYSKSSAGYRELDYEDTEQDDHVNEQRHLDN